MDELSAVSGPLSAEDVKEDGEDDVRDDVRRVFDDGVEDEEDHTDVLGAVGGEEESNTSGLDGISEHGLNLVKSSAAFIDFLGFLNKSSQLSSGNHVLTVLLQDFNLLLDLGLDGFESLGGALVVVEDGLHVGEGVDSESAGNKCEKDKSLGHFFQINISHSTLFPIKIGGV